MVDINTILGAVRTTMTAILAGLSVGKDMIPLSAKAKEVFDKPADQITEADVDAILEMAKPSEDEIDAAAAEAEKPPAA